MKNRRYCSERPPGLALGGRGISKVVTAGGIPPLFIAAGLSVKSRNREGNSSRINSRRAARRMAAICRLLLGFTPLLPAAARGSEKNVATDGTPVAALRIAAKYWSH